MNSYNDNEINSLQFDFDFESESENMCIICNGAPATINLCCLTCYDDQFNILCKPRNEIPNETIETKCYVCLIRPIHESLCCDTCLNQQFKFENEIQKKFEPNRTFNNSYEEDLLKLTQDSGMSKSKNVKDIKTNCIKCDYSIVVNNNLCLQCEQMEKFCNLCKNYGYDQILKLCRFCQHKCPKCNGKISINYKICTICAEIPEMRKCFNCQEISHNGTLR